MKFVFALMALIAATCGVSVYAADPITAGNAAQAQPIVDKVCSACHGSDGNSVGPENPVLAGQHADYIAKQLSNFKSGARKNPVMTAMASTLSPQDINNLAVYFQGQKRKERAARDPSLVALGQQIYRGGIAAHGIPACSSCHGPSGAGIPSQYPRLAQQYPEYTLAQLQAFRSGERANDPNSMMRAIAARLSDQELKALSEYIAGLH